VARTVAWAQEIWTERATANSMIERCEGAIPTPKVMEITEVPVYIQSRGERLAAIVTVPEDPGSTTGVVLLASRARDRAHRNGLWVKAARTLASDSLYVLRLDYPGVGNSTGSPQLFGQKDMPSWAVDDACRFLLDRTPVRRVLLVGTCYGALVVLDTASRLPEIAAAALVVAPVLRPLSPKGRMRIKAARLFGRGAGTRADLDDARSVGTASMSSRRIDPSFAGALRRFLARGRVCFL
jgi:pimeloyl-ACP methyl ester carboxylesterase